jgi:hypothetical protein
VADCTLLRISLAEQAWVKIDRAVNRVRGRAPEIVREMQETLKRPEVVALCQRVGICSAGFMFLDRFTQKPSFFTEGPEPSPTYQTPYISTTNSISNALFDELHRLFVHIRTKQNDWTKISVIPEYLRYLPSHDFCIVKEEREIRDKFGIHHCSYGETVVTAFLWRALIAAQSAGLGSALIDAALPVAFGAPAADLDRIKWAGEYLLEKTAGAAEKRGYGALRNVWAERVGVVATWRDEWRALRLVDEKSGFSMISRLAGLRFCKALGIDIDLDENSVLADSAINTLFSSALQPALNAFGCTQMPRTVDQALARLEEYARFPIPPFYIWNAIDEEPKVYSVAPVWSSQGYPFEYDDQQYYHFGLALTALRPIKELDWTWPAINPKSPALDALNTDPLVVTSLLKLMARPLVEPSVYGELADREEARKLRQLQRRVRELRKENGNKTSPPPTIRKK